MSRPTPRRKEPGRASRRRPASPLRLWLDLHKPRGSARSQLFLAEMMWTVVGSLLLGLGLYWVVRRYDGPGWAYAAPFLALGALKALLILDRVARRTIHRIRTRGDDHCLGGFFSPASWAVVLGMMILGQLLRALPLPRGDVGFLYVAVGSALLISSRTMWREWHALRAAPASSPRRRERRGR